MTAPAPVTDPEKIMETWEVTTAGRIWIQHTGFNRFNQPMIKDVSYGPNKVGHKFKISQADREMNQERVQEPANDPFRNGLLVRLDKSQQDDPMTESPDAVSTKDLLAIFAKNGNAFHAAVDKLGEVPVRRLLDLAPEVDATAAQVDHLREVIEEKFRKSQGQGLDGIHGSDAIFDLSGERRTELEK